MLSAPELAVYKVVDGSATDTLSLTAPGTSAQSLIYKYVGGGFWQHTVAGTSSTDGSLHGFTYGASTPATSVPRSGSASYSIDILGSLAELDAPKTFRGTGLAAIDFAGSSLTIAGNHVTFNADGSIYRPGESFTGTATLSASANTFTGTMRVASGRYAGVLTGQMYGPAADELGAAFYLRPTSQTTSDTTGIGIILGRKLAAGTGLAGLTFGSFPVEWGNFGSALSYARNASTGRLTQSGGTITFNTVSNFAFDSGGTKTLTKDNSTTTFSFGASAKDTATSDAVFTNYRKISGTTTDELALFNPGATNTKLALTYVSFGSWRTISASGATDVAIVDRTLVYGQKTAFGLVPVTGTATYDGIIYGSGAGFQSTSNTYTLNGTAHFAVDFGGAKVTASILPILTLVGTSTQFNVAQISFSGDLFAQQFNIYTPSGATTSGEMHGTFFGPNSQEIGALLKLQIPDPNAASGFTASFVGAAVGKKN